MSAELTLRCVLAGILAVVLLAAGALAFAGGCIFAVEADDVRGVALIAVGAAAFIAGVIIACGLKVVKPNEALVLTLFGLPGNYTLGCEYLRYISLGAVFQILGTGLVPFIRNMGGAVTAMAAMVAGFVGNIVLDYLFVWVFGWGMRGAAIATDAGQAMTFLGLSGPFLSQRKSAPSFPSEKTERSLSGRCWESGCPPSGLPFLPTLP